MRRPPGEGVADGAHRVEQLHGTRDGVDPELGLRAVSRTALHLQPEPREPAMGDGQLQIGGLDDHRTIDRLVTELPEDVLRARRAELLVCHEGQDDVASRRLCASGSDHRRRDPALHVVAPAAVETTSLDPGLQPVAGGLGYGHGVEMAVDEQGPTAAGSAPDCDHAGLQLILANRPDVESALLEAAGEELGHDAVARAAEADITRVDAHERREQIDHVVCGGTVIRDAVIHRTVQRAALDVHGSILAQENSRASGRSWPLSPDSTAIA